MPNHLTGSKQIEVTELMNSSVILSEYNEDSVREYFISLAHIYKKARMGDTHFTEICQNRAERSAKVGHFFSTCGEWVMFLLDRAGYRGPILNRDQFLDGKQIGSWQDRKNIEYIFYRGKKEGVFIPYLLSKQKERRPKPGDICYIAVQGKPRTEHVFMFEGLTPVPGSIYEHWTSIDGGQGGVYDQHIAECQRLFNPATGMLYGMSEDKQGRRTPKGEGRPLIGWLDISLLPYTAPANLSSKVA